LAGGSLTADAALAMALASTPRRARPLIDGLQCFS
jgi:hypothetical protein